MTEPERFDVVIVGAGQAGLAVGYYLARSGIDFVTLDAADRVGDSWRQRWDSLRLFTPARYDRLPGLRFPGPAWSFPRKDDVADYLESYARRFALQVRSGVRVDRLSWHGDHYVVAAGDRRFLAGSVVVATGAFQTPWVPGFASEVDPGIVTMHSSDFRNASQLNDGEVLVVGAGNSGAEIALDVSRTHRTWLSGRDTGEEAPFRIGSLPDRLLTPPLWFLLSRVLTVNTSAGRKLREKGLSAGAPLVRVKPDDLTAAGVERVPRTTGTRAGHPVLEDGRVMSAANIIWCTGFREDFGWIDLPVLDKGGAPLHRRGVVAAQPGLYFVGQFFLSSITSSLLGGVGKDARYVARHIARHGSRRGPDASNDHRTAAAGGDSSEP
jgi:putative flavoprotein involved in K+ transport